MYFPYLRGRQYELIALRELVERNLISDEVIPVMEPIKPTSTLLKTMKMFLEHKQDLAIIQNPQVGNFVEELSKSEYVSYKNDYMELLVQKNIIRTHILNRSSQKEIEDLKLQGVKVDHLAFIHSNPDFISIYQSIRKKSIPRYNFTPYDIIFRRKVKDNNILLADRFPKQPRNVDYLTNEESFFSKDHLYYKEENYVGFSDYSIVGLDYSETGFAPMAVAIHIVYFDHDSILRIKHFVSDSNEDIKDTPGKFYEALDKLIIWNEKEQLDTYAMKELKQHYENQTYPGLGSLKKLSIMHHIELVHRFLSK